MDLTFTEHSIPKQQNAHSSQVHVEHSPGQIICGTTKQVLIHLRKPKSYQAYFPTAMYEARNQSQEENWKIHKYGRVDNMLFNKHWAKQEIKRY